jgi:hypothetical protein
MKKREEMQVNVAGLRRNIKNIAHNYSDAQVSRFFLLFFFDKFVFLLLNYFNIYIYLTYFI